MSNNLKSLEELTGLKRITKKILLNLCKKNQLYQTPRLNDVLYLHYQGFRDIEELDEYTGLKCLWLECNAISEIKNLTCQPLLKCLFLQNNLVRKIENLNGCPELDTLNLSHNHIANIENCGIDILPVLTNLNLANNYIRTYDGLKGLLDCKMLSVLDLSNNRIEDVLCVKIFSNMPELRVLILQGNPVVGHIPQYRKTLILECYQLTYLDSRPVFPKDRACAEAWKRGGYEEEKAEHERWIKEDQRKMRENVNSLIRLRNSMKNGKQQEVKLLTSDDENVKTDDETSSGSSSDTNLAESLSENETETDNEKNNNNDNNLLKDIPEKDNTTNEEESFENLVKIPNTLENLEQNDLSDKEERDASDALKKFRKKESEKTIRKCKEHKKSNERIWPKKYLLCEEPETILASANIFDEKLHVSNEETVSSPKIVEQILHQIISDIKISQELEKPPQLELKNDFPKIQTEENQNKNLEIEDILEAKYFDDLIDELKSPIVLEEQNDNEIAELNENETAQLNENEEFTPEEFNYMMDILKQNQNETCAANNVTSMDPVLNIPDTGLELTSSGAVCDQNSNDILTLEDHENSIESLSLNLTQNNIADKKETENPQAFEKCEKLQEEIVTLKETEVEENVPIISYRILSNQVKNKIAGVEEFENIDLTEDQKSIETQKPLEQMQNEINVTVNDENILVVGLENKSSLPGLENSENLKEELGLTEENQCKLMKINTEDPEKSKPNFNLMEENKKEIVEVNESEEAQKAVDLKVEETFCSLPSEQSEHIISETDEYEEFKETKEQFSSDDENFKTSSDFDSHLDSDSDTDTDNENVTEHNLNTMDESLKEMAESLNEIEKDLKNQKNFEEQLNEEVCYSKHMRVTRSEMNRRKCKAHKLSNNRDWLRKYLLQEEPEDVLATSISYHKTLIDFPLKWNPNSDENQTAPPIDMNFIEERNDSLEFQSCSSILEEIQKNISEANFESEHQDFEIKPHEVNPEPSQNSSFEKEE